MIDFFYIRRLLIIINKLSLCDILLLLMQNICADTRMCFIYDTNDLLMN